MAFNNRYNSITNSNPIDQALENDDVKVPLSRLNYSRSHYGNENIGTIEILDCFETMPNGKYDLSVDYLLKSRSPLTRRIFNGLRCYIKSFYMSWDDLWEGAQNHVDHGRSGLLDIPKPSFDGYLYSDSNFTTIVADTVTPNSVLNQLGAPVRSFKYHATSPDVPDSKLNSYIPCNHSASINNIQDYTCEFNALTLAMYQRIWISKIANKNLLQNNKHYLPDNIAKQRISYSLDKLNCLTSSGGSREYFSSLAVSTYIRDPNSGFYTGITSNTQCLLSIKRFAQKKGTYFDTASPFADLIRGDIPSIPLAQFLTNVDFSDVFAHKDPALTETLLNFYNLSDSDVMSYGLNVQNSSSQDLVDLVVSRLNNAKVNSSVQAKFTANTLRTLLAANLIKERAARTNGDYREFVKAMYGKYPKVNSYEPTYIGGCYQDIVFSDVTSTSESATSPLGKQAGQAMSANHGEIGSFTAPDFGYIMTIAYLVPDDIENQGVPRFLSELSADDVYLPPNNNLPPQAIKNIEIFATNSDDTNNDVWAYTERYEHLRARDNYASGFVGLSNSVSAEDKAMLMHVRHASLPNFNHHFSLLTPDNVDMSVFSVSNEPPFFFQAVCNVSKLEPIPYDSTPADFGFKYI